MSLPRRFKKGPSPRSSEVVDSDLEVTKTSDEWGWWNEGKPTPISDEDAFDNALLAEVEAHELHRDLWGWYTKHTFKDPVTKPGPGPDWYKVYVRTVEQPRAKAYDSVLNAHQVHNDRPARPEAVSEPAQVPQPDGPRQLTLKGD